MVALRAWFAANWRKVVALGMSLAVVFCCCGPLGTGALYGGYWLTRPAQEAAPPPTATPAPSPPTATPVPPAPTATPPPAAPPPAEPAASAGYQPEGLKYQHDVGCAATSTPMEYPACILQRVQAGELTGEQAVVMIQALAVKYGAHNEEAMTVSFDSRQPVLGWCPGGVSYYPPDTARPLSGTAGQAWVDTLFVVDRSPEGEPGTKWIEAVDHPCWVVYRR